MLKTIEGVLDSTGNIHFSEEFELTKPAKVLVTILPDENLDLKPNAQTGLPSWVGKYSSDGAMRDDRDSIYDTHQ